MPKTIFQDVVPPEKRTIRNVPLPERRRKDGTAIFKSVKVKKAVEYEREDEEKEEENSSDSGSGRNFSRIWLWSLVGLSIVILVVVVLSLFESAKVQVKMKEVSINIDKTFKAGKSTTDNIQFASTTLSLDDKEQVPFTGEEKVETKATGKIIVYNNFGPSSQTLIKGTRFETENGLIYRINANAVVPGKIVKNGVSTPGSVELTVTADDSGEKYNIGLTDFQIPGFKGTTKYGSFYAKSKTAMTGGFSGVVKKVTPDVKTKAIASIESRLKEKLLSELKTKLSNNSILFDNLASFSFVELPQTSNGNLAVINVRGTIDAVVFNPEDLENAILAVTTLSESKSNEVDIFGKDKLSLALVGKDKFSPKTSNSFSFNLKGELKVVWLLTDEQQLKSDLSGKPKNDLQSILNNYPVTQGNVSLSPFWKGSFPEDTQKIKIEKL